MRELSVRPEAEADIEDIADYTIAQWGREQARTYVAALRADIESLAKFAVRFPVHETSGLGLREIRSGHHLVLYLIDDDSVEIVRILHERMEVEDWLG